MVTTTFKIGNKLYPIDSFSMWRDNTIVTTDKTT